MPCGVHIAARHRLRSVAPPRHLTLRAVQTRGQDGGNGAGVTVQRGIYLPVRHKGAHVYGLAQAHRGRRSLHVTGLHARRVGPDGVGALRELSQHGELSDAHIIVHHQSKTELQLITSHGQRLERAQTAQHQIEGIEVIARLVLAREEGFARVLRPREAQTHIVAHAEVVAHTVPIPVAQIALSVALPLIKGHLGRGKQRALAVAGYGGQRGETFLPHGTGIYKAAEQLAARRVERLHEPQLGQ